MVNNVPKPKIEVLEWLQRADKDLAEADFLYRHDRPYENVAYFIHQAVEKYLKAFLLHNGWVLEKTHDLVKLTETAKKYDKVLGSFIKSMRNITGYYIESRYPVGYTVSYRKDEIVASLRIARCLKTLISKIIMLRKTK